MPPRPPGSIFVVIHLVAQWVGIHGGDRPNSVALTMLLTLPVRGCTGKREQGQAASADMGSESCHHVGMTAFWSGVVAALIGAIVGGLFTAVAAAIQARAAAEAASRQLHAMFAHEVKMRDEQHYRNALAETTLAMSDFSDAMTVLVDDHKECRRTGAECSHRTLSKQVHDAAVAVSRCGNLYWDLWEESQDIQLAFELASELLSNDIDDFPSLTLSSLVKESYEVAALDQKEACCGYGLLGYHSGGSIATGALTDLKKKMWSGMRLPAQREK
jgi:hypothetical protein